MFDNIKKYFSTFLIRYRRTNQYTKIKLIQSGEESKSILSKGDMLVVTGDNIPKWLRFYCPCGCGKEIVLSLSTSNYHGWSISTQDNKITVDPSVIVEGCGSHFWIKNSTVKWV